MNWTGERNDSHRIEILEMMLALSRDWERTRQDTIAGEIDGSVHIKREHPCIHT